MLTENGRNFKAGDKIIGKLGRSPGTIVATYRDQAWVVFEDDDYDYPSVRYFKDLRKPGFEIGKKYRLGDTGREVYEVVYMNDEIAIFLTKQEGGFQSGTWDSHEFFGSYTEVAG